MSEAKEVLLYALGLGSVYVFAVLYTIGGRKGTSKAIRRWVGGVFLALACLGLAWAWGTFSWWSLGLILGLPTALSLGYGGGGRFKRELVARSLYGALLGLQCAWVGFNHPAWDLILAQVALSMVASIYLGVRNPIKATGEEMLIASLSVIMFPFLVSA